MSRKFILFRDALKFILTFEFKIQNKKLDTALQDIKHMFTEMLYMWHIKIKFLYNNLELNFSVVINQLLII